MGFDQCALVSGGAEAFAKIAEQSKSANPRMLLSVFAENSFATRWLDGVNQIHTQTTFTHIWEQGYVDITDAQCANTNWQAMAGSIVETSLELWYTIKAGYGYQGSQRSGI